MWDFGPTTILIFEVTSDKYEMNPKTKRDVPERRGDDKRIE